MCSVVECDSWRRGAHRFKLPLDPEMRLEWVKFLFEVNGQRLKESSWTDITICTEHFTHDCYERVTPETGTVQLKSSAVPSLCIKSEPEEPEEPEVHQEAKETSDVDSKCDQLETCDSPSHSEASAQTSVDESPAPADTSDAFMSDYSQMIQKVENLDMIREKAALLHMKGKYVVNESRLLQLFSPKCPLCGSKVKVEKFTYGVLLVLNQQCGQCEYRNQWKSQVKASIPTSGDEPLTEGIDITSELKQTVSIDVNNSPVTCVSDIDEESDPLEETDESDNEGNVDSDSDWTPMDDPFQDHKLLSDDSDEESEVDNDDPLAPEHSQLCTDCGKFFNKRKPHTCEHKMKPYCCNICGKRCISELTLTFHSKVHDENYEHPCKYCNVTFKTKVDKLKHEQIHATEEKPYKCPDCPQTFAKNKERRIHLEEHRGPRQLKCHICGIEFYRTLSLRRHLAVHTGVKAYKCSVCQRGFSQPSHLKSHMRLHTGERPYKCQHCDKCFTHNVSLKSHVQRYHAAGSGPEQKKSRTNESDAALDDVEEGRKVQKERTGKSKCRKRSTGRPIGRPKRNAAGNLVLAEEVQGPRSNTKAAKVKVRKSKGTHCSDEESDMSFDSAEEEEERSEKVASGASRSRGRVRNFDSDSDFDPELRKKKRCRREDGGAGKSTGRPRKNDRVEDV